MAQDHAMSGYSGYDEDDDDRNDAMDGRAPFALPGGLDPASGPVLPPLIKTMNADLFISHAGSASILHDQLMPDHIAWVEYDVDVGTLTLITWSAQQIPFGAPLPPPLGLKLRKLRKIFISHLNDQNQFDVINEVPLVVRHIFKKTKTPKQGKSA